MVTSATCQVFVTIGLGALAGETEATQAPDMLLPLVATAVPLRGRDKGRYAVDASGNWRITFGWDGDGFGGLSLMSRNRLLRGLRPMHPGEMLREDVLPALGKSKAEIARLLGISRQTLYDIIAKKQPVTPAMALRLGKLCGNGPDLWINLQRAYDLVIAERELAGEIKNIPTLTAA